MPYFEISSRVVNRPSLVVGKDERFWRQQTPVMVGGVVVRGGMWEAQRTWWNLPNFVKVFVGGLGAGKTMIGCKRLITLALQNAPCPVAVVSPSFPLARRTVIPTLTEMLAGKANKYGPAFWWRYHRSLHEFYIKFHGRSATIYILSGEDPSSLRGPNLAAAYLDEPFLQDEEVWKQMNARVRHPQATMREVLMTGTPEGISSWGYELCKGKGKQKNDVGVVHVSTRQNLALPADYVGRLMNAFAAKEAAAYVEGEFVAMTEGLVYYGADQKNFVELPMPENAELGVGMDFNVNPMAATVFWRAGAHMHYVKEYELPNADTEFMCETLLGDYPRLGLAYPDATGSARKTAAPAGKTDFSYIRAAGLDIRANYENPKRRDRYNAVNGKLAPKGGDVKPKPTVTISPDGCPRLVRYLSTYAYEQLNKQEPMSHLLDAFSYPIAYLYPVDRGVVSTAKLIGH